jgi:outer membrane protein assembly factor BamB
MPLTSSRKVSLLIAGALLYLTSGRSVVGQVSPGEWRQWGGPNRNFVVDMSGLAPSWPATGPQVLWSRPLGVGHSSVLVDQGRLFTMYRVGNGRAFQSTNQRGGGGRYGVFAPEEFVVALDAATGKTMWEYKYVSQAMDFSYGPGPHSTPLIVGDRLFATGTNKQLFALDKGTGKLLWSRDLIKEYNAPWATRGGVDAGYCCGPVPYNDLLIMQVGGPGQAVMAFRQSDGSLAWKSGDFLYGDSPLQLINVNGQDQVAVFGAQTVNGVEPTTGKILWTHPHAVKGDRNHSTPLWVRDNILFVSSAYDSGSRALRLTQQNGTTKVEELWFSPRLRVWFSNVVWHGDLVYGSSGDFGPAFLTALNTKTGEMVWQTRDYPKTNFLSAGDRAIMLTEDGDLFLARLSSTGVQVLAKTHLFDTVAWTVPTLVGTTLYARNREKIVALDLGSQ